MEKKRRVVVRRRCEECGTCLKMGNTPIKMGKACFAFYCPKCGKVYVFHYSNEL
jgi:predicted RNA-binding Zn-ribbon protein involved in translation (DUF1610 family)